MAIRNERSWKEVFVTIVLWTVETFSKTNKRSYRTNQM